MLFDSDANVRAAFAESSAISGATNNRVIRGQSRPVTVTVCGSSAVKPPHRTTAPSTQSRSGATPQVTVWYAIRLTGPIEWPTR